MGTAILALLVALAPALVEILKMFLAAKAKEMGTNESLTKHSLDELHAANDELFRKTPVSQK